MRVRVKSESKSLPGWYGSECEHYNKQTACWEPYYFNKRQWSLPSIHEETISDLSSRFSLDVKSCDHTISKTGKMGSQDTDWREFSISGENYRDRYRYGGYTNQAGWFASRYGLPDGWVSPDLLPHKEAADFLNEGGVKTEMSLINFMTELPEMKTLLSFLLSKGLKKISGGYLAYEFGMKPLFGDLQIILNYSISLQKRLDWLLRNNKKNVSLHFRKTLSNPGQYTDIVNGFRWQVLKWSHEYMAFGSYAIDYNPVAEQFEKLRYFNQYFGTLKLLTALWEGIPYSFVIDWVTNFGELIRQFELPSKLSPSLSRIGWSQKFHVSLSLEYLLPNAKWQGLGDYEYKRYHRQPGLPLSLASAVDFSTVTGRQQALLFSLIHQRW